MSVEQWILLATAVVALAALIAVVLLAVQLRRTRAEVRAAVHGPQDHHDVRQTGRDSARSAGHKGEAAVDGPVPLLTNLPAYRVDPRAGAGAAVSTSDGARIVPPSSEQVAHATMGRPMVRGAVLSHGIWYALRPENRDRVGALVRREYRRRRKERRRAGRRAARMAAIPAADAQSWLGMPPHRSSGRRGTR